MVYHGAAEICWGHRRIPPKAKTSESPRTVVPCGPRCHPMSVHETTYDNIWHHETKINFRVLQKTTIHAIAGRRSTRRPKWQSLTKHQASAQERSRKSTQRLASVLVSVSNFRQKLVRLSLRLVFGQVGLASVIFCFGVCFQLQATVKPLCKRHDLTHDVWLKSCDALAKMCLSRGIQNGIKWFSLHL